MVNNVDYVLIYLLIPFSLLKEKAEAPIRVRFLMRGCVHHPEMRASDLRGQDEYYKKDSSLPESN